MVSISLLRFVSLLALLSAMAPVVESSSSSSSQPFGLGECKCCSFPRGGQKLSSRLARPPSSKSLQNHVHQSFTSASSLSRRQRRRACGFYLWDAPSAILYRWCHHLQRDCIYEGRGGKKVDSTSEPTYLDSFPMAQLT